MIQLSNYTGSKEKYDTRFEEDGALAKWQE
jgi:hypothetical protein